MYTCVFWHISKSLQGRGNQFDVLRGLPWILNNATLRQHSQALMNGEDGSVELHWNQQCIQM